MSNARSRSRDAHNNNDNDVPDECVCGTWIEEWYNRFWVHDGVKKRVAREFGDAAVWDTHHNFQRPTQSEFRARLHLRRGLEWERLQNVLKGSWDIWSVLGLEATARAKLVPQVLSDAPEIWVTCDVVRVRDARIRSMLMLGMWACLIGIALVVSHASWLVYASE